MAQKLLNKYRGAIIGKTGNIAVLPNFGITVSPRFRGYPLQQKTLHLQKTFYYTCSCQTKIHGGTPFNVLSGANNEYLDIHGY